MADRRGVWPAVVLAGAVLVASVLAVRRRQPARAGRVPGRPRFVVPAASPVGTVRHLSPAGQGAEAVVPLPVGRSVIGRGAGCELRLEDPTVSRVHAEVVVGRGGSVLLRDLEAENGLRVDGRPVAEALLVDGNRVQLGAAVLVFRSDSVAGDAGREGGELGERPLQP